MKPTLDAVNRANGSEARFVVPAGARTVNDAVADWRKLVAPHRKPRGVETSESHLKAHNLPELGQVPLSQVNVRRVQEFVNKISGPQWEDGRKHCAHSDRDPPSRE